MSPQAKNHGGGVDSGGADTECGRERIRNFIYDCTSDEFDVGWTLSADQTDRIIEMANENARAILTKSLCTLQALVSNMEESGATNADDLAACPFCTSTEVGLRKHYVSNETAIWFSVCESCEARGPYEYNEPDDAKASWNTRPAVLGTFDLEGLKTLVGEIDDVLGGSR